MCPLLGAKPVTCAVCPDQQAHGYTASAVTRAKVLAAWRRSGYREAQQSGRLLSSTIAITQSVGPHAA